MKLTGKTMYIKCNNINSFVHSKYMHEPPLRFEILYFAIFRASTATPFTYIYIYTHTHIREIYSSFAQANKYLHSNRPLLVARLFELYPNACTDPHAIRTIYVLTKRFIWNYSTEKSHKMAHLQPFG